MLGRLAMLVIVKDDLVEERSEHSVGVVRSSVNTNAGISVLAAREDSLSEGEAMLVSLVLELVPDGRSEVFLEERLGSFGELRELDYVLRLGEVGAYFSSRSGVVNLSDVFA